MSEHTPVPWFVEEGVDGFPDIVSDDCGEIVGQEGFYSEIDRDWKNARHIVKAVNYHDRLREALEHVLNAKCPEDYWDARALLAELDNLEKQP